MSCLVPSADHIKCSNQATLTQSSWDQDAESSANNAKTVVIIREIKLSIKAFEPASLMKLLLVKP